MTSSSIPLRIGTRGSPLALAQAHEVRDRLASAHAELAEPGAIEIVVIKTTGDIVLDRPLAEIGGKGLFTKEIDQAMLEGRIDLAVHSMKDVATILPDGIILPAILPREDPRDAWMCLKAASLAELAPGAVVGTASLRRGAQVLFRRPDVKVVSLRGNVQTRMRKLEEGVIDATMLAMAGLNRLGLSERATGVLDPAEMLPAVGQGAVGVTCRDGDEASCHWLAALADQETTVRIAAERAFLTRLDGSCRTPIAGLAEFLDSETLRLRGMILKPDGSAAHEDETVAPAVEAAEMGTALAEELLARAGPGFLEVPS